MTVAIKRQLAVAIDLNKCLGCQTCTLACKKLWTKDKGQETMYWANVETRPGVGYPRSWFDMGVKVPNRDELGEPWTYDLKKRLYDGVQGPTSPKPRSDWGVNWDEDQGDGEFPNASYFYLPRTCNHCDKPACLEACPQKAIYKREEDGLVIIDQSKCTGSRRCIGTCPYKKVYFNPVIEKAEKCIGCFPRTEKGVPYACAATCPGRVQRVGNILDPNGAVHKLVKKWKVALPLMPDSGTEPNVFYVPPLSPPREDEQGRPLAESKIPIEYLEMLFGDGVKKALDTLATERDKKRQGEDSELMDLLIAPTQADLFDLGSPAL